MAYLFQTIVKTAKIPSTSGQQYRDWFRNRATQISRVDSNKLMTNNRAYTLKNLKQQDIGRMVMFFYDAKTKDTLPYWDKFPLVFPIEYYDDGFLGINLHYLPPMFRAKLMDQLYTTANNDKFDSTTKLRITYGILKGASQFRLFRPCIKRYLTSHIKSRFLHIPSDEWDLALMLPSQRFQKAKATTVWRESLLNP